MGDFPDQFLEQEFEDDDDVVPVMPVAPQHVQQPAFSTASDFAPSTSYAMYVPQEQPQYMAPQTTFIPTGPTVMLTDAHGNVMPGQYVLMPMMMDQHSMMVQPQQSHIMYASTSADHSYQTQQPFQSNGQQMSSEHSYAHAGNVPQGYHPGPSQPVHQSYYSADSMYQSGDDGHRYAPEEVSTEELAQSRTFSKQAARPPKPVKKTLPENQRIAATYAFYFQCSSHRFFSLCLPFALFSPSHTLASIKIAWEANTMPEIHIPLPKTSHSSEQVNRRTASLAHFSLSSRPVSDAST